MVVDADQVRERLRAVEDPALGSDIVSLGLVDDVRIDGDAATVSVSFNAPYAPEETAMGNRIREEIEELGLDPSVSGSLAWKDPDSPIPNVRNVVPISSGKGGVGKTTVATNLATALAESGARVGLLDADIYGPNVPGMLGVEGRPGVSEAGTIIPPRPDGIAVMSASFIMEDDADPAMLRGPMIDKLLTELLTEVEWGELDYLLVDLPPGTGDAPLSLLQTVPVTGAVVVTTPEDIALSDVRKGIRMFTDRGTPVLGVVENMSSFRCPNCGDEHALYGSDGGAELAAEFDLSLLAELPMDPEIRAGADSANPVVALEGGPAAEPFFELRDTVANRIGAVNRADAAGIELSGYGVDPDEGSDHGVATTGETQTEPLSEGE